LTREEEVELAKRIERGDLEAKGLLVNSNLRLGGVRSAVRVVTSLDRPVGESEDTPFGALLASDQRGPEEEVDILLREDALRRALDELPDQEREVVTLRYGVGGDEPTPLVETGRRLGISQDTVRRLERKALAELAQSRELDALRPAA